MLQQAFLHFFVIVIVFLLTMLTPIKPIFCAFCSCFIFRFYFPLIPTTLNWCCRVIDSVLYVAFNKWKVNVPYDDLNTVWLEYVEFIYVYIFNGVYMKHPFNKRFLLCVSNVSGICICEYRVVIKAVGPILFCYFLFFLSHMKFILKTKICFRQ